MPSIIHVSDSFCPDDRHVRAQATWYSTPFERTLALSSSRMPRDSTDVGCARRLLFLKDVLTEGMSVAERDSDIVLWANSDVGFRPEIVAWTEKHLNEWPAVSFRRSGPHIGRDAFAFRVLWLKDNWENIPDFLLAAPCFDLVLAAMIRLEHGIQSTLANMETDIPPADCTERFLIHEDHPSSWAGEKENELAANKWNQQLAREWCAKFCPALSL